MSNYIGRFAPSPSGPLHLGSIVAALASYLDAKSHHGKWLIRIEDIDPPREVDGAASHILSTLESLNLHWDGAVLYQSQQSEKYTQQLTDWLTSNDAYACQCTRKIIKSLSGRYDGRCQHLRLPTSGNALRFVNHTPHYHFKDRMLGHIEIDHQHAAEDFIIHRRDGLFAYQLAVVLDDIQQGITHVVRGKDLLDTTLWQLSLFDRLTQTPPAYAHIPLVMGPDGRKLSKQNHAPAVDISAKNALLLNALSYLSGCLSNTIDTELLHSNPEAILAWAVQHWSIPTPSSV